MYWLVDTQLEMSGYNSEVTYWLHKPSASLLLLSSVFKFKEANIKKFLIWIKVLSVLQVSVFFFVMAALEFCCIQ